MKDVDFWASVGVVFSGIVDVVSANPVATYASVFMMLVAFKRYQNWRIQVEITKEELKQAKLKRQSEEVELEYQKERLDAIMRQEKESKDKE